MNTRYAAVPWSQVEPYLDCALDLESDPPALAQWLAELTAARPDIGTAVRTLLAEREALNASGFLMNPPFAGERMLETALERASQPRTARPRARGPACRSD